ncbi:MAG: 3-dehydroquinate synthase [Cryomorphaceae bacterium]
MTERIIESPSDWKAFLEERSPSQIVVLTDENTSLACLTVFQAQYLLPKDFHHVSVDAGEKSKTLDTVHSIYQIFMDLAIDRSALLINLGGGMITDLGGFVGATYKRGISMVNVPTTHLGMVDAALGGKNGVNFKGVKNQIGAFYPVQAVVLHPQFLDTLDERELMSGWIETVKHAVIADSSLWDSLCKVAPLSLAKDINTIRRSAEIKSRIASEDTADRGIRQALNFGHTVGHAIESQASLLHGEAVAIGMVAEIYLSQKVAGLDEDTGAQIIAYIKNLGLPIGGYSLAVDAVLDNMRHDKKNTGGELRFALISHLGRAKVGIGIHPNLVKESLDFAQHQLST